MRILAISDIHGDLGAYHWFAQLLITIKADVGIVAGDLTRPQRVPSAEEKKIKRILTGPRIPILFLMGNDDLMEWTSEANFVNLNQTDVSLGGYQFVGYQYTNPFVGGLFDRTEELQALDLNHLTSRVKQGSILVTHGPPYGILDVGMSGLHVGSIALKLFIEKVDPILHISGHIHEGHGRFGKFLNVSYPKEQSCCMVDLPKQEIKFLNRKIIC